MGVARNEAREVGRHQVMQGPEPREGARILFQCKGKTLNYCIYVSKDQPGSHLKNTLQQGKVGAGRLL